MGQKWTADDDQDSDGPRTAPAERFRTIDNVGESGDDTVIYDTENGNAWIQASFSTSILSMR